MKIACNSCPTEHCEYCFIFRLKCFEDSGLSPKRCTELAKAEKEGRLEILPVAVGGIAWCIEGSRIFETKVRNYTITQTHEGYSHFAVTGDWYTPTIKLNRSVGETVFLTREEAEAALKERQGAE